MSDLSDFAVTSKWPVDDPSKLQLFSYPTPNGQKVSILLEELGLPYEPHLVPLGDDYVKSAEYLSLNPNNKIPAIIDPDGPDGKPLGLWESGAILIYLAEKTGKLIGKTPAEKAEIIQWVMFQMGGVGPMFGQLGFFYKFAGAKMEDKTAQDRYIGEAKRLLAVVEKQLEGRDWLCGDYSIADIALAPWLHALDFYGAKDVTGYNELTNVPAYVERFYARPAAAKGRNIPDPKG
ncbi:glutathione S-transferase family protein [Pelagovum pacificum]|uniref:Glutathione S-transferase n=1 Tax=Pelagovum pacificum TaxID=2588711 RepID=A0A5C5GC95_9RHOB|nr:glutathione S-transferase N-terminal domain-containing protein [Pelagovum pacificum]QQA42518.1 glutathione S-transferase N-terminal domain-containing protein [Pelagovum pacificum]TNY31602.1 glutathione S-transferase [Pelagovum pacificum]